jgi:hypothetical protein
MQTSMTYEGVLDWFGRECKSLVSFKDNKWSFEGLNVPGLQGFEIDVGKISHESKNRQKISDLIAALDNLQFRDCQKRKKWHERLKKENNDEIRREITGRLLDSEDETYKRILEIIRLLKGTAAINESAGSNLEGTDVETRLDDLLTDL